MFASSSSIAEHLQRPSPFHTTCALKRSPSVQSSLTPCHQCLSCPVSHRSQCQRHRQQNAGCPRSFLVCAQFDHVVNSKFPPQNLAVTAAELLSNFVIVIGVTLSAVFFPPGQQSLLLSDDSPTETQGDSPAEAGILHLP